MIQSIEVRFKRGYSFLQVWEERRRSMYTLASGKSRKQLMGSGVISLHFAYYNFCRVRQSLRITPAMAAGITDHVWTLEELVSVL